MKNFAFFLRQVARRPLLYTLIVLILALGIGANTAMFTLTDAVLFRQLPVQEAESLVRIFSAREKGGEISNSSFPAFERLRENTNRTEDTAAYMDPAAMNVTHAEGATERIFGGVASGNFFELLGVPARLGRVFSDTDDVTRGAHPVAVISHHYWRTRFDASEDVIGKVLEINRQPFEIIGVLPAGFSGLSVSTHVDVWLPLTMAEHVVSSFIAANLFSESMSWLDIVARRAPGVSTSELQAELDVVAQAEAEERARQTATQGIGPWRRVMPAEETAIDPYGNLNLERNAWLLVGVMVLVLMLACANVAGLLTVRAEERQRELVIRASMGASQLQLIRMVLTETLMLALAGALAGFGLAQFVLRWITAQAPQGVVLPLDPATALLHMRVLAVTAVVAVLVTLLVGLAPALCAARLEVAPALKGGAGSGGRPHGTSWRGALVIAQIGISTLILVGAGLMVRSLWNTVQVDPGFDPHGVAVLQLDISNHGQESGGPNALLMRIRERVEALPGVEAAGFTQSVPVQNGGWRTSVQTESSTQRDENEQADLLVVTPGFLSALGGRIVAGRDFQAGDLQADGERVVLVNEAMARHFWPGEEAVGKRITNVGEDGARVVGVVADHKLRSLREQSRPIMYGTFPQYFSTSMSLLLRGSRDPLAMLAEARRVVREIDPTLPIVRERTLAEHLSRSYAEVALFAWLFGGFALLAVLLACTGLYGMLAHILQQRRREFGIRMTLGADNGNIAGLVVRHVVMLSLAGLAVGLLLATAAGRLLDSLLFGVGAFDVATFAVVVVLVSTVAAAASFLPVQRAASTQPVDVLREE